MFYIKQEEQTTQYGFLGYTMINFAPFPHMSYAGVQHLKSDQYELPQNSGNKALVCIMVLRLIGV
jgi:hypothetical protein